MHSLSEVARHYTASPSRFWFDVGTSVPLSYTDLYYAEVASPPPAVVVTVTVSRLWRGCSKVSRLWRGCDKVSWL